MIEFTRGNLLESKAEALVNTVNTVGVMGKGVALIFKEAFASLTVSQKRNAIRFCRDFSSIPAPHWIEFSHAVQWRRCSLRIRGEIRAIE